MENTPTYCGLAVSANTDYLGTSPRYTGSSFEANIVNCLSVCNTPSGMTANDDNYGEGSSSGPGTAYYSQAMGLGVTTQTAYYNTLSPQDPLFKAKTARRVTINGQTGIFFEYHYPHIVVPSIQEPCNQNVGEVPMSQPSESKGITDLTPRECVLGGCVGKFFPDQIQQNLNMPYSSIRGAAVNIYEGPANGRQPNALHEQTLTYSPVIPTVTSRHSSFNTDNDPGIRSESEVVDTSDEELVTGLDRLALDGNSNSYTGWKDKPKRILTPKSEDSEHFIQSNKSKVDDGAADMGVQELNLVIKRWQATPKLRRKEKLVTFSHNLTIPNAGTNFVFNYRHPTWANLKTFFEKHCKFKLKTDMIFIDDYGANKANYFDQLLEDRIEAMIKGGLGDVSNTKGVNWVYKVGIIIVDLTNALAFKTFMKEQNPYDGMKVQYERKSPKDCHLFPPWVRSFRELHLDHDRTLVALKNGVKPNEVTPNLMAEFNRPQPERDLNFEPPKGWCGEETPESAPEPSEKDTVQIRSISEYVHDGPGIPFNANGTQIPLDSPMGRFFRDVLNMRSNDLEQALHSGQLPGFSPL